MNQDNVDLYTLRNYRKKTYFRQRTDNPIDEISLRIQDVLEEIKEKNKRYKPEVFTDFKCKLFNFEENRDDEFFLLKPQININIHVNNPIINNPSFVFKKNDVLLVNNKKEDNLFIPKLIDDKGSAITQITNKSIVIEEKPVIKSTSIFSANSFSNLVNDKPLISQQTTANTNAFSSIFKDNKDNSKLLESDKNNKFNIDIKDKTNNSVFRLNKNENIAPNQIIELVNLSIKDQISKDIQVAPNPIQIEQINNIIVQNPVIIPSKQFQNKLILMSQNYNMIKEQIEKIIKNPNYKENINRIIDKINLKFNQVSTDNDIRNLTTEIISILKDLERNNKDDFYIFSIDYVCKRLITKSEGYNNDSKKNIFRLSKIVSELDRQISMFGDYFFSIIAFRCPFIIPKIYNKKECKSEDEYSKKMGFAFAAQNAVEHWSDMESHSYLFFGFLQQANNSSNFSKYVEYFTENLFNEACIYPLAAVVNGFIDSYGTKFKERNCTNFNEFCVKITNYIKLLEGVKNNCKSADIKAKVNTSIHFIKKNIDCVKKNLPTSLFKD